VTDDRLKGIPVPAPGQVWDVDPVTGECRVIPEHGVVLAVTDEHGHEACFGFLRYPRAILDIHGNPLVDNGLPEGWYFRDFLKTADPRIRQIVAAFREAGYVADEKHDYTG